MNELEMIRQRNMQQMQDRVIAQQAQSQEVEQLQQQIQQLESALKSILSPEAMQRYNTIKMAHPETAVKALLSVAQLASSGKITRLDDSQFKALLSQIEPKKRETVIRRV